MPKLIYFYVSDGARAEHVIVPWNIANISTNRFAVNIANEGMFQLWDKLAKKGIFAHVCIFVDSMRGGHGHINITKESTVFSVPHLEDALGLVEPDDIIVARGGFKPWYNVLEKLKKDNHWILFYRANTNRNPWPFWDVILDDLISMPLRTAGRLHFNFSKPVNEDLFYRIPNIEKKYDVLLNASHIHPKKGQHRFIRAALEYKKIYGENISICLPGGFVKSWAKQEILNNIKELNVTLTGSVPREKLNILMNESHLYVHIGTGGQNDRGALEAMRCGLPVVISNTKAFAPFIYADREFSTIIPTNTNSVDIAILMRTLIPFYKSSINLLPLGGTQHISTYVTEYYNKWNGMDLAINKMKQLFEYIFDIGKPNREEIMKRYSV